MISPERFLALLEEKDLLSPRTVASLREQIANSAEPITAAALAKRLIKHGRITQSQAKRLLAGEEGTPPSKSAGAKPRPKAGDDLGFAPTEGEAADGKPAKAREKRQPASRQPAARPAARPAAAPTGSLLDDEAPASVVVLADSEPLGGLMSDAAMTGAATGSPLASAASGRKSFWRLFARKPKGPKKSEEEKWGGGLMLMGGGGLVVLLLACGFLIYAMNSTSSDKMFNAADGDYRGGSYPQAIGKYKAFLDKFPSDERASLARVRIGLAKLWQATPNGANWSTALQVADEEVKKMAVETAFKDAHSDLASLLSKIAENLVAEARKKPTNALVDETKDTLAMVEKYVPKNLRPESKLADVKASLAIAGRDLARGNELDKTLAAMQKATKELKTAEAYAACGALLHQYPDLASDVRLKKALMAASLAQQGLVKTFSEAKPASKEETQTAVLRSVTLAQCDAKGKVAEADGQVALAAVDGAVYGLDAVTGRVLWRRMVGFDANPQAAAFPPTPFSSEPGSDALVVATARNEVLRIEGKTGRLQWRHAIGEPFDANPVIAGDKILVATRSGKLITIAAKSGESKGYIRFPQALCVAPTIDVRRSLIYQVAAHTNLFVLSLDQGVCKHVAYLGHEPASITTAPVIIGDYLLVAVNDGARDAVLRVYAIEPNHRSDKPDPWLRRVQEIRLGGHLQMSPLVEGQRVLVTTNSGFVRVFELSATDVKTPLREVAQTAIEGGGNLTRFALMQNGQFWIADNRLTKYDVQAARGRLMPKSIECVDSAFLQPPVVLGQAVVSVRRKLGMPGAIVSALAMQESNTFWETRIASPLAAEPLPLGADGKNDGKVVAVTANGGAFKIDASQNGSAVVNDPIVVSDFFVIKQPISYVGRLAGGVLAISGGKGGERIGVFEPASDTPLMRWLKVPGVLACAPASLGRGILAPCKAGQVYLLDPDPNKTGDQTELAESFQPRIEPGVEVDWMSPAIVSDTQAILADGKMSVYLIGVQDQPKPHLAAVTNPAAMAKPLGAPPAVLGQTVFTVDTAGGLGVFALPALARGSESALGGRCAWGPARVGDNVLVSTDDGQLLCFDSKGSRLWRIPLEYGPLAGAPLRVGSQLLLASRAGIVWRAEAATGKELAKVDAGYPLATGPVLCGQKLLVGGHDGTLYEVRQP